MVTRVKGLKISQTPELNELTGKEMIPYQYNCTNGKISTDTLVKYAKDNSTIDVENIAIAKVEDLVADEEDLTLVADIDNHGDINKQLKFADKTHNPENFSGLGRVYLRKNIIDGKNVLTQNMISKENTIYIIQYDYDLNGSEITVPENCVLKFEGGSFSNGTIIGNNSVINANRIKIFGSELSINGTWNIIEAYPEWFGEKTSDSINKSIKHFKLISLDGTYTCDKTISVNSIELRGNNYTTLDFSNCTDDICVYQTGHGAFIRNLTMITNNAKDNQICYKLYYSTKYGGCDNLRIVGFNYGMQVNRTWYTSLKNVNITGYNNGLKSSGYGLIIGDLNEVVDAPEVNAVNFSDFSIQGYKHDLYIKNASLNGDTFINLTLEGSSDTAIKCVSSDTFNPQGSVTVINPYFEGCHTDNRVDMSQYEILDTTNTNIMFMFYGGRWANNQKTFLSFGNFFKNYGIMDTAVGFTQDINALSKSSLFSYETLFINRYNSKYLIPDIVDNNYINAKIPNHFVSYFNKNNEGNISLCNLTLPASNSNDGLVLNCIMNINDTRNTFSKITKFYTILIRNNSEGYYGIVREDSVIGIDYNSSNLIGVNLGVKYISYRDDIKAANIVIYSNTLPNYGISLEIDGYRTISETKPFASFTTIKWETLFEDVDSDKYSKYITLRLSKKKGANSLLVGPNLVEVGDTFFSLENGCSYRALNLEGRLEWRAEHKLVSNYEERPNDVGTGFFYFDEFRDKPIWRNGDKWVDANGNEDSFKSSGTFSQKPNSSNIGYSYFCTDRQTTEGTTNGIMIYHKGNNVWVDALGRIVE